MKHFHAHGLNTSLPIYVTRKTADGETADYSMSLWMTAVVMLLAWANIVVWGVVGLIAGVGWFF